MNIIQILETIQLYTNHFYKKYLKSFNCEQNSEAKKRKYKGTMNVFP